MTKMAPTNQEITAPPPRPKRPRPIMHGGMMLKCTDKDGKVYPCLNIKEWNRNPTEAIARWVKDYGLKPL